MDLRKALASTILVVGGTPMLPGFIPRLHAELVRAISTSPASASSRPPSRRERPRPAPYDRYAPLCPLLPYFTILNNPSPPPPISSVSSNAGKAPAFTPATMSWVGGSLAGYVSFSSLCQWYAYSHYAARSKPEGWKSHGRNGTRQTYNRTMMLWRLHPRPCDHQKTSSLIGHDHHCPLVHHLRRAPRLYKYRYRRRPRLVHKM